MSSTVTFIMTVSFTVFPNISPISDQMLAGLTAANLKGTPT